MTQGKNSTGRMERRVIDKSVNWGTPLSLSIVLIMLVKSFSVGPDAFSAQAEEDDDHDNCAEPSGGKIVSLTLHALKITKTYGANHEQTIPRYWMLPKISIVELIMSA
jgi:hypothetical protein